MLHCWDSLALPCIARCPAMCPWQAMYQRQAPFSRDVYSALRVETPQTLSHALHLHPPSYQGFRTLRDHSSTEITLSDLKHLRRIGEGGGLGGRRVARRGGMEFGVGGGLVVNRLSKSVGKERMGFTPVSHPTQVHTVWLTSACINHSNAWWR